MIAAGGSPTSSRRRVSPSIAHTQRSAGHPGAHSSSGGLRSGSMTVNAQWAEPSRHAAATSAATSRSGQAITAPAAMPGRSAAASPPASAAASASSTTTLASSPASTPPSAAGRSRPPSGNPSSTASTAGGQCPAASCARTLGANSVRPRRSAAAPSSSSSGVSSKPRMRAPYRRRVGASPIGAVSRGRAGGGPSAARPRRSSGRRRRRTRRRRRLRPAPRCVPSRRARRRSG